MRLRRTNLDLFKLQIRLRLLLQKSLEDFNIHSLKSLLESKTELLSVASNLKEASQKSNDELFFASVYYTIKSFLLLAESYHQQVSALPDAEQLRKASEANITLLSDTLNELDQDRPSTKGLSLLRDSIIQCNNIKGLSVIAQALTKLSLPFSMTIDENKYKSEFQNFNSEIDPADEADVFETTLLSVVFYIDRELWANPQVVKPQHLYNLHGVIKINEWPKGYDQLILSKVSTTDDDWFTLSLPVIKYTDEKDIFIDGQIILKYAQSILDAPISIKILAQFSGPNMKSFVPRIIGYDQLILRVVDKSSFMYPTGYNKLNEKVLEIVTEIQQEFPNIPQDELENFMILLSAILNYQGYCYQQAIYKNEHNISEDKFRDKLIEYLSARSELASSLVKEGIIAGGRVEINFKGIIAELKVEKEISDRQKIIEKYQKQPAAYASATGAQLSILCVLDLTAKINPPSIAAHNIFFQTPMLHGFENAKPSSKMVIIVIDGNTPNPSAYK